MAAKLSIQDYLTKSEQKFRNFKSDYQSFTTEAHDKFLSLVRNAISPSVSTSSSGSQVGVTFNVGTDETAMEIAREYLGKIKAYIDEKSEEFVGYIDSVNQHLQIYFDEGVDWKYFLKLVNHLNDLVAYIPKMSFEVAGNTLELFADDEIMEIKKKWNKISAEKVRNNEKTIIKGVN